MDDNCIFRIEEGDDDCVNGIIEWSEKNYVLESNSSVLCWLFLIGRFRKCD